ncbi:MAG: hypothetical protein MR949_07280 [Veillonellaceae bacterium]|nr:hypothetical protein [Veillonellaceae bacterium]
MDNTNKNQEETSRYLIDIFYKDDYRLNSLISQINNGALQSVVTKTDKTQGSVSDFTGSLGVMQFISASGKGSTSESIGKHIEETRKIGDESLLKLIEQLNINPQECNFSEVFSCLNIISGSITLRNFKLISQMIPLIKDSMGIFEPTIKKQNCLEEMAKLLKAKSSKTPDDKRKLRELESELYAVKVEAMPYTSIFNNLHVLLPFLPTGIGLEVLADDSTVFTGSLKSEYLIDSEETISLNYGTTLPGKWNVLGILDYKTTSNDEPAQDDVVATLHKAMSGISNLLVNPNSKATVIPIMIYRNLNL